jgi:hypothetical protein
MLACYTWLMAKSQILKVKNTTGSIVSLPHNDPADLIVAALRVGIKELSTTGFCAGNEAMVEQCCARPELFVCPGTWRAVVQELAPGQTGEVNVDNLLPKAREQLSAMTAKGGSLTVL